MFENKLEFSSIILLSSFLNIRDSKQIIKTVQGSNPDSSLFSILSDQVYSSPVKKYPNHPIKILNSLLKFHSANLYFRFQCYSYNNLYCLIFVQNDSGMIFILLFNSSLILFSWWRNKIS